MRVMRQFFDPLFSRWIAHANEQIGMLLRGVANTTGISGGGGGASYLVQESDGTSRFTLEDGSGSVILEV